MIIILLCVCVCVCDHHMVYLKHKQFLFVNFFHKVQNIEREREGGRKEGEKEEKKTKKNK